MSRGSCPLSPITHPIWLQHAQLNDLPLLVCGHMRIVKQCKTWIVIAIVSQSCSRTHIYIYTYRFTETFWIFWYVLEIISMATKALKGERQRWKLHRFFLTVYHPHAAPLIPMSSRSCEFDLEESSFSCTIFPDMLSPIISPVRTQTGLRNLNVPQVLHAIEPMVSESGVTGWVSWNKRVLGSVGRVP